MARKNMNPNNLVIGSKVTFPPRADGIEYREGNGAVWEIVSIHEGTGSALLHLVGAEPERTAGGFLASLIPAGN